MTIDLLTMADSLRNELQAFYFLLRRGEGNLTMAAARLRQVLDQSEQVVATTCSPAEGVNATLEQRWGYVQLVTLIDTARHELTRHGL